MAKKKLYVCVSLDVEEEGLFSGAYPGREATVANVARLRLLEPLYRDLGFPLTLFCSWQVFQNPAALKTLDFMRANCGAEIGAHLHHWSTPPFTEDDPCPPMRTHLLPKDLFRACLDNLLETAAAYLGHPARSFRMGRWDLKRPLLEELAARSIKVDSSICPLRKFSGGADHFLAPAAPYRVSFPDRLSLIELPITQISILPSINRLWHRLTRKNSLCDLFHFFGAASPNPLWHSPAVMRMAAILHTMRHGQILNLFWHSSEMLPGASPHIPNEASANRLLDKIWGFCSWLTRHFDVTPITIGQVPELPMSFPTLTPDSGDW